MVVKRSFPRNVQSAFVLALSLAEDGYAVWMYRQEPAVGIRKAHENNERHRFLSGDEIARFLLALREDENSVAAAFFEFLLYTRHSAPPSLRI
jgi:hypothetical protein